MLGLSEDFFDASGGVASLSEGLVDGVVLVDSFGFESDLFCAIGSSFGSAMSDAKPGSRHPKRLFNCGWIKPYKISSATTAKAHFAGNCLSDEGNDERPIGFSNLPS